jgi:hypothetical protein
VVCRGARRLAWPTTIGNRALCGARLFLNAPWALVDGLKLRSPFIKANDTSPNLAIVPLSPRGRALPGEAFFRAGAHLLCRLLVTLPPGEKLRHAMS